MRVSSEDRPKRPCGPRQRGVVFLILQLAWAVVASGPAVALAQGKQSASAAAAVEKDEYAAEVEAAVSAFNQSDFARARSHFARAHELRPSARTWRGLGNTAFELKDFEEAIRELTLALEDKRAELPGELRSETEQTLRVARRKLLEQNAPPPRVTAAAPALEPVAADDGADIMSGQRIAALGLAGAGLASVAVGVGFGLRSLAKGDDRDRLCPDPSGGCSPAAVRAADAALTAGNIATVAFVVGGVAVAGGVVLWLTGAPERRTGRAALRPGSSTSLALSPGFGTLQLRGTF